MADSGPTIDSNKLRPERWVPEAKDLLRIVAAYLFLQQGTPLLLGTRPGASGTAEAAHRPVGPDGARPFDGACIEHERSSPTPQVIP